MRFSDEREAVRLNTLAPNEEGEYTMTEYGSYRAE